jgi:hypothetical protein
LANTVSAEPHQIAIHVDQDHLEKEASATAPAALAELVWNSLDADAETIEIRLTRGRLGAVEKIEVLDDGHGIHADDAERFFAALGGSWKKNSHVTRGKGRTLHGKEGKGRLKAFALGSDVSWNTSYRDGEDYFSFTITGSRSDLRRYQLSARRRSHQSRCGTSVVITGIKDGLRDLDDVEKVIYELAHRLAMYLRMYPDVRVRFDGNLVNPKAIERLSRDYTLPTLKFRDGSTYAATMSIIEWAVPMPKKTLCLCNESGYTLDERSPEVKEPSFEFSAYLKSPAVDVLAERNVFGLAELDPDLQMLLDIARPQIKAHFRARKAEEAADQVRRWREMGVYPYADEPTSPVEEIGRQVFDVVAKQVQDYLPGFGEDIQATKFSMRLMRQALEDSPKHLQTVVNELLDLPEEKQKDLAALIDKGTTFIQIIDLARQVTDRLTFLEGLRILLFDKLSRNQLLERKQLHKIVEQNAWLFGEEYTLGVSDRALDAVLEEHLKQHKIKFAKRQLKKVERQGGSEGIVDLMLSRSIIHPGRQKVEHLVVELKRPKVKIGSKELDQTIDYARSVVNDPQFKNTDTIWRFWAVSNELDQRAEERAKQRDKPIGLVHDDTVFNLQVWAMSWGTLLDHCHRRLHWVKERLSYAPTDEDARDHLRQLYEKYLPKALLDHTPSEVGPTPQLFLAHSLIDNANYALPDSPIGHADS